MEILGDFISAKKQLKIYNQRTSGTGNNMICTDYLIYLKISEKAGAAALVWKCLMPPHSIPGSA